MSGRCRIATRPTVRDGAEVLDRSGPRAATALTAPEAKASRDAYGIPCPARGSPTSADEAVSLAEEIGFPVVLKIVSPDILHKTEAGGVLVGLSAGRGGARRASTTIIGNARGLQARRADRRASRSSRCSPPGTR